jgi:hypothetical protein
MTNVVGEACRIHDIRIKLQTPREFTAHLSNFQGVCQTIPSKINPGGGAQDLRLRGQSTQRAGVEKAGTITSKITAPREMALRKHPLGVSVRIRRRAV